MSAYLHEVASRLVAFDTVSSRTNLAAAGFLADHLESHGFRTRLQRFERDGVGKANVIACAGPPRAGGLILSGHVDTVPFEGQPGWKRDPLRFEVDGDRIYGRGTADMKCFLAQCLDAARRLEAARLERPLVFLFTADEEVGCQGAARLAPELASLLGDVPLPPYCWIGEPTSYEVLHAHKSIAVFSITVRGRGGHSGLPQQGVNAIAVAGKVIVALGRLQAERRARPDRALAAVFPEAPYDVLNLGMIRGGTAVNMIAEECVMTVSYRALPDRDPRELHREIDGLLAVLEARDDGSPDGKATIEVGEPAIVPPMLTPRGTPLEAALFSALGHDRSRGALFVADGALLAPLGVATLLCGPGEFTEAHQPNESIDRTAFERGAELILRVVEPLCGSGAH